MSRSTQQLLAADAPAPEALSSLSRRPASLLATLAEASTSTTTARRGAAPTAVAGTSATARGRRADSSEESEEASEGGGDGDTFGNLKTQLVWDCVGRRLCLSARQYAETDRKLEVKLKGMLDTASGQHRVWGHLRRNFYTHVPLLQRLMTASAQRAGGGWVDEPNLDPDAFLPGGVRCLLFKDWAIGPGVSYDTARAPPLPPSASTGNTTYGGNAGLGSTLGKRVKYQLAIKKNPQVLRNGPRSDVWVQARALAEFDPKASEVALGGSVRLKAIRYGLTGSGQDLRASLGWDWTQDEQGRLRKMPYVHLSDGKLGCRLQNRRWQIMYTL
ncbi:hypothetical protein HYH03_014030 [Edaphochlamys debaryana]|uniref:Uncharacterized protein n=1 Tax=Edaphochlamys debaryana TaxID=47281 RepID=A0A835XQW1_9CHLO|nr:hypothetical protein HYH03_014030 [Edaphochlamys debaryana]|eukprot:KAG2487313.1 hypothetical protein HYH03_014030 [Edaphochlamys debaryana]